MSIPNGVIYINDKGTRRIRKVSGGIITTFAGNGNFKNTGDGGAATSAFLSTPFAASSTDSSGNLYIAETARVRKVAASTGIISTLAGGALPGTIVNGIAATSAMFSNQVSDALPDNAGNFYISSQNRVISKVNNAGIINQFAGTTTTTGFGGDGGPAVAALLNGVRGIVFDAAGNLYLADGSNNRVRKIDTTGTITTIAGTGTAGFSGDGGPASQAAMKFPAGLSFDGAGNLYVAEQNNNCVRMINPTGIIKTIAGQCGTAGSFGGDGAGGTAANLNAPIGVAADANGNVYIADSNNHRIRRVDLLGNINTVAGTGTAGYSGDGGPGPSAKLNTPQSVWIDATSGNLYISDSLNDRIRMLKPPAPAVAGSRLTITTTSLSQAVSGSAYNFTVQASGGTGAKTWQLTAGTLPGTVTLSPVGAACRRRPLAAAVIRSRSRLRIPGIPAQTATANLILGVTNGAVTTLSFTTQPSTTVAGQIISPAVQVSAGVANVDVTLALGNNPNSATLGGTLTVSTNVSGIANFTDLTVSAAGQDLTLVASVGAIHGTSANFNINPATGGIITVAGSSWLSPPTSGISAVNYPIAFTQGAAYDSLWQPLRRRQPG